MHVSGEAHGQDDEFTAAFEERHSQPAPAAGDDGEPKDKGDAGSEEPADKGGADADPTEQAKDPWEGASPELLAARDAMQRDLEAARHSDNSQRGRIAALQRQINQGPNPTPQQPQGGDKPDKDGAKQPDPEAEARAERLKNLREDYPDIAGPLLDLIDEARNELKAVEGRVSPVIDASNEAAVQAQEKVLGDKHPDWREVGGSQDFAGWASSQSPQVQALASSFDAAEVSAALTLFKLERDASKAKDPNPAPGGDPKPQDQQRDDRRDRQLRGGREATSRGAPTATGAPDEFDGAFEFFRAKRERQQAKR